MGVVLHGLAATALGAALWTIPGCECDLIEREFDRLVDQNQGCSVDEDCAAAGGAMTCECSSFLGPGGGVAVNRSVAERVRELAYEYWSKGCGSAKYCDGGGPEEVACRDGTCVVTSWTFCNVPDGGWEDNGWTDPKAGDTAEAEEGEEVDPAGG